MSDQILYLQGDDGTPEPSRVETDKIDFPQPTQIMIPAIGSDGEIYPVEKIKAHREGIHHLAFSVFVFDGSNLLIQRRADSKYHCAGLWANTCCSHPHIDEDIYTAATRRLQEELGFSLELQPKGVVEYSASVGFGMHERERVHLFSTNLNGAEISIEPNPDEVSDVRWISPDDLERDMRERPTHYTPWFRIYAQQFPGLDLNAGNQSNI